MFSPKSKKFKKVRKGRIKGIASSGTKLAFGTYGIKIIVITDMGVIGCDAPIIVYFTAMTPMSEITLAIIFRGVRR